MPTKYHGRLGPPRLHHVERAQISWSGQGTDPSGSVIGRDHSQKWWILPLAVPSTINGKTLLVIPGGYLKIVLSIGKKHLVDQLANFQVVVQIVPLAYTSV